MPDNGLQFASTQFSTISANQEFAISTHITSIDRMPVVVQVVQDTGGDAPAVLASYDVPYDADAQLSGTAINGNPLQLLYKTLGTGGAIKIGATFYNTIDVVTGSYVSLICSNPFNFGNDYRFGFNGQEKDNEIKGIGNSLDFGARWMDTRTARLGMTIDPLFKKYPSQSPYVFAGNNPIYYIDVKGKHKYPANNNYGDPGQFPLITKYLSTQLEIDIANSTKIQKAYVEANPNLTMETVKSVFKWGSGPEIEFVDAPGPKQMPSKGAAGFSPKDDNTIQMNAGYARYVEGVLSSNATYKVKQATFMRFYMTLIHETGHKLDKYVKHVGENAEGHDIYIPNTNGYNPAGIEEGYKIEELIWGTDKYKPYSDPKLEINNPIEGIQSENYEPGRTEEVINKAEKTKEGETTLPTVPKH